MITQYFIDIDDLGKQGDTVYTSRLWQASDAMAALRLGKKLVAVYSIDLASGGDYAGDTVTRSNFEALQERGMGWRALSGGYGSYGIIYRSKRVADKIASELDDYPLLDEDHLIHLEMQLHNDAWRDYGERDYYHALAKADLLPDDLDIDVIGPALHTMWFDATEQYCGGEAYKIETGCTVHYDVDRVVECMQGNQDDWVDKLAEISAKK